MSKEQQIRDAKIKALVLDYDNKAPLDYLDAIALHMGTSFGKR